MNQTNHGRAYESTVLLVLNPNGGLFSTFLPMHEEDARSVARAIGGLIVAAPVVADYRCRRDQGPKPALIR